MRLLLLSALLFSFPAHSAEIFRLNQWYKLRSSNTDFYTDKYRVGEVSAGTTVEVLSRKKLASGAEAVEVKIINTSGKSHVPNTDKSFYIWNNANEGLTDVANADDRFSRAEITARPTRVSPNPKTAAAVECEGCNKAADPHENLRVVNRKVEEQNSVAPVAPKAEKVSAIETLTQPITKTDLTNLTIDEKIKRYSESEEVSRTVKWAELSNNVRGKGRGACYRRVKEALATKCDFNGPKPKIPCTNVFKPEGGREGPGNNLVVKRWDDNPAVGALKSMPKLGFKNLLEIEPYKTTMADPKNAPKGAVLVYASSVGCKGGFAKNFSGCGHVEIKMDHGRNSKFISDYMDDRPITDGASGRRYKLVGVMIKDNL